MKFEKVFLVSAPAASPHGGLRVPSGIGYIAQALHDNSIPYEYLDMRIADSFGTLKRRLAHFKPDLIGFSMSSLGYKKTYSILSRIKEMMPTVKIVVGGYHPTTLKEKVLEGCTAIDFAVIADGENTIIDLCQGNRPLADIKGLVFREGESVVFTGERLPVKNLDELKFPRYEKFDLKEYSKQIPIISSRGCVFHCTFCPNGYLARTYRIRSVGDFVNEIEHWYRRGIRQFAIDDDNFTLDKERTLKICDEIDKRGLKDLFIRCSNGIRADTVDRELMLALKRVGVREVGFGVESGSDRVLQSLKKGEDLQQIEYAIGLACELGFDVKLFFLIGTPFETRADIESSIQLAKKYPVSLVNFNNPIPYPGTELFDYLETNRMFVVPPEDYIDKVTPDDNIPVFETPYLSIEERKQLFKRCRKLEKEIFKKSVQRMFSKHPLIAFLLKHLFVYDIFEKLFFENLFFRNVAETIRYRALTKK
jgi:radical SAM superfamily enzyme YgiQ (UPF0313 family)